MDGILLITNAAAGSNEEQAVADAVDVLAKDHDVEVAATKEPGELAAVLDRCDGRPVVVAGGDGALHAVVNGLPRAGQLESTCLGLVPLGNGKYVGGGTALIPGAEVGDGQLVVIVSKAVGRWGRVAYAARLHGGTHHMMKEVIRVHGRSVTVKGEPFHTVADGEIAGPFTERCWELLGSAVRMY